MTRRGDPEKIYQAQRAGIFMRLASEARLDEAHAEHLIARWEREAEATGRSRSEATYWDRPVGLESLNHRAMGTAATRPVRSRL